MATNYKATELELRIVSDLLQHRTDKVDDIIAQLKDLEFKLERAKAYRDAMQKEHDKLLALLDE